MEIIWVLAIVIIYWLALSVGQSIGERRIKRRILWYLFDYRNKTVNEMFDEILSISDEDWMKAHEKK